MMMRSAVCVALALLVGEARAQPYGSGSGPEPLTARVMADVFRERVNNDSTISLVVLWRGQKFWMRRGSYGSSGQTSGAGFGTQRGATNYVQEEGNIKRSIQLIRGTHVVIDSRDTLRAFPDSTLVVMVDRIDSVGGAPIVTAINVPRLPAERVTATPPVNITREEYARLIQDFMNTGKVDNRFSQFLNTIPAVREFLSDSETPVSGTLPDRPHSVPPNGRHIIRIRQHGPHLH